MILAQQVGHHARNWLSQAGFERTLRSAATQLRALDENAGGRGYYTQPADTLEAYAGEVVPYLSANVVFGSPAMDQPFGEALTTARQRVGELGDDPTAQGVAAQLAALSDMLSDQKIHQHVVTPAVRALS